MLITRPKALVIFSKVDSRLPRSIPIEADEHLLAVLRYGERNPLRAKLCKRAEDWEYGSAWLRQYGDAK